VAVVACHDVMGSQWRPMPSPIERRPRGMSALNVQHNGIDLQSLRGGSQASKSDRMWPLWYPVKKTGKKADEKEDAKEVVIESVDIETQDMQESQDDSEVIDLDEPSSVSSTPVKFAVSEETVSPPEQGATSDEAVETAKSSKQFKDSVKQSKQKKPQAKPKRFLFWGNPKKAKSSSASDSTSSPVVSEEVKPVSDKTLEEEMRSEYLDTKTLTTDSTSPSTNATTSTNESPATVVAVNETAPITQPQMMPPIFPDLGGGIILMSPPGSPYRTIKRMPPGVTPGRQPTPVSSNNLLLAEVFASVIGAASRLFILTWLTRRIATQQEVMHPVQHFVWESLNDRYARDKVILKTTLKSPPFGISVRLWKRKHVRKQAKRKINKKALDNIYNRTCVVLEVKGDNKGGIDVEYFADVVTFLLQEHRDCAFGINKETGSPKELEVIMIVNSPGGSVASYGLAAAQMQRLRGEPHLTLTTCVDKYAASGGYMIASQSERILAAPFATVGSIGVIVEGLNFHETARRLGVLPLVIKAGDAKNPLSMFGPVTNLDVEQEEARVAKVHDLFRALVKEGRPMIHDIEGIGNGDIFMGEEALRLQLIDGIMTSSEYISSRVTAGDRVLKLHRMNPSRAPRRPTLTPMDILPHLRSGMWPQSRDDWVKRIAQASMMWEFARYMLAKHFALR
jgi:ClpP class serine protease